MKIFTKAIMAAAVMMLAAASQVNADDYKLVWQENFNGDELNSAVWNIEENGDGGGNNELQYYTRSHVAVEDGNLVLTARRKDINGKKFASGRINSQHKMYFTHGKIEIRACMPETANGLWPAMWSLGENFSEVGWPRCSEIDYVEMGNVTGIKNGTQNRYFNGACHWGFYKNGAYPNYANSVTAPYSMQGDYHTWTIIWDTEAINMYYDLDKDPNRAPYYAMGLTDMNGDWATGKFLHQPMFLVFNVAVGGNFTGIFDPAQITAIPNDRDARSLKVDYVKLYQKGTADETFFSTNGSGEPESGVETIAEEKGHDTYFDAQSARFLVSATADAIRIYTLQGVLAAEATHTNELDLSCLATGVYVAQTAVKGDVKASKIVVR